MNARTSASRQEVVDFLIGHGFSGEYPRYVNADKCMSVLVTEEHPFTLSALEYENYEFRLQFMVSETSGSSDYLNQGFFMDSDCGKNKGWIAKSVREIV